MNVYALNTLDAGADTLDAIRRLVPLAGVIGLSRTQPGDRISGYRHMRDYCDAGAVHFVEVQSYSLGDPHDRELLLALDIDILLVVGWQRLVPDWLIRHCRLAAVGSHGSAAGITGGRGRSPQNWALLTGRTEFSISLFRLDAGVDSGPVIDTRVYRLSEFDDIRTSYYKASLLTAQMMVGAIRGGALAAGAGCAQAGEARYLPQRLPEDGEVDWSRTTREIYDFVRALTRPYPGAFGYVEEARVRIWRARPFDLPNCAGDCAPGEVARRFASGDLLVKTGDGLLLVEDYQVEASSPQGCVHEGVCFRPASFRAQMCRIVERHRAKFPDLPLSQGILRMCNE